MSMNISGPVSGVSLNRFVNCFIQNGSVQWRKVAAVISVVALAILAYRHYRTSSVQTPSVPQAQPQGVPGSGVQGAATQPVQEPLAPVSPGRFFDGIDSSITTSIASGQSFKTRTDFFNPAKGWQSTPPCIGASTFITPAMLGHLMRNKKDEAVGTKYVDGDHITNGEACLHTFVVPVGKVAMTGDLRFLGGNEGKGVKFNGSQVRNVIYSFSVQPDFEKAGEDSVMLLLVQIQDRALKGIRDMPAMLTQGEKRNPEKRRAYDEQLVQYMIHHLSPSGEERPGLAELKADQILKSKDAVRQIEAFIQDQRGLDIPHVMKGQFVQVTGSGLDLDHQKEADHLAGNCICAWGLQPLQKETTQIISLELLFAVYVEQLRNEFKVLNPHTPQGYIYTIDPSSIFAAQVRVDGARAGDNGIMVNRLQALAFKHLAQAEPKLFSNMQAIAFNDFMDPSMVGLLQKALPGVQIVQEKALYQGQGNTSSYVGTKGLALVLHNNSDGFGQNIEHEKGERSLDAVRGVYSDAAHVMRRDRGDLLDRVVY